MEMKWDYAIWSDYYDEVHRGPMSREEAEAWMEEWLTAGGMVEAFRIVRRPSQEWQEIF